MLAKFMSVTLVVSAMVFALSSVPADLLYAQVELNKRCVFNGFNCNTMRNTHCASTGLCFKCSKTVAFKQCEACPSGETGASCEPGIEVTCGYIITAPCTTAGGCAATETPWPQFSCDDMGVKITSCTQVGVCTAPPQ